MADTEKRGYLETWDLTPPKYHWHDIQLPFANPPSDACPTVDEVRSIVASGRSVLWCYKGLWAVIPLAVLANALSIYDAYKQHKHLREKMPESVGVIFWNEATQYESLEQAEQSLNSSPGEQPPASDKA